MDHHVVIAGAGQVGYHLARNLVAQSIPVVVIENDIESLKELREIKGIKIIEGHAESYEILKKATVSRAKLIFSALSKDSQNILTSLLAKDINPSIITVARIRNKNLLNADYLYKNKVLPIDMPIYPERIVAKHLFDLLKHRNIRESITFLDGRAKLISIKITHHSNLINKTLIDIKKRYNDLDFIITAISREGLDDTIIPNGTTIIKQFDSIYLFILSKDEDKILKRLGYPKNKIKNAILIGGGTYGKIIAEELAEHKIKCRLIEINKTKAKKLDEELLKTIILHGDGKDEELLKNNKISKTDLLISATHDGFTNIIISNIAKELGTKITVSLTFNRSLYDLSHIMGVDICLNPRYPVIGKVLTKIYSHNIRSIKIIANEDAEIVELLIKNSIKIIDKKLKDINLGDGVLIALIEREGKLMLPTGEDSIKLNDKIFLFILKKEVSRVLDKYFSEHI